MPLRAASLLLLLLLYVPQAAAMKQQSLKATSPLSADALARQAVESDAPPSSSSKPGKPPTVQVKVSEGCGKPMQATAVKYTFLPDPPVLGKAADFVGSGTLGKSLKNGTWHVIVELAGGMFTLEKSGDICSEFDWELPMNFGTIHVKGPKCPTAPGAEVKVSAHLIVPKNVPSGTSVKATLTAKDQDGGMLLCGAADIKVEGGDGGGGGGDGDAEGALGALGASLGSLMK